MFMDINQFDVELHKHATANLFAHIGANLSALALLFFICTAFVPGSAVIAVLGIVFTIFTYAWSFQKIRELEQND